MNTTMETVRAAVGPGILAKADRLFKNDDPGIWIEILQNARRAGATVVEVTIAESEPGSGSCVVTVQDNGRGIQKFQDLLTLGQSGWDAATQAAEDPAGMGFFALCHTGIEVHSGDRFVEIAAEVFLGSAVAEVRKTSEPIEGTRLRFSRASTKNALAAALHAVTEFYPVEVLLDGEAVPRHDFLEGCLHRELIDGIEVGFGTYFTHASNSYSYHDNWNFHGARIRDHFDSFPGLIDSSKPDAEPQNLFARFNVLETGRVRLQLPDRRAIIQDDLLKEFYRKVRSAAYRYFQLQPQHVLPYRNWVEARELGVTLPEAAYLLSTWCAAPHDDSIEPVFGYSQRRLLAELSEVMLVARDLPNEHTFEAALACGATLPGTLWNEEPSLEGYSWYEKLRRVADTEVLVDGISYQDWRQSGARPLRIEVKVTISQSEEPNREICLPASIHVDSEEYNNASFVAVGRSPWDNDALDGPFDVVDFLVWATFVASDDSDADSWYTQREEYEKAVTRQVNEYFRGMRGSLLAILRDALDWDARRLAQQIGVTEIRFRKGATESAMWDIELG